jgi:hypothetical protein
VAGPRPGSAELPRAARRTRPEETREPRWGAANGGGGGTFGPAEPRAEAFTRRDNAEARVSSAQETSAAGHPGSAQGSAGPSVHPRGASSVAGVL